MLLIILYKASSKTKHLFTGNAMNYNNNQPFSTKDRDNDDSLAINCAVTRRSGWWHRFCTGANLNGHYYGSKQGTNEAKAIYWRFWKYESLKQVDMKIKLN